MRHGPSHENPRLCRRHPLYRGNAQGHGDHEVKVTAAFIGGADRRTYRPRKRRSAPPKSRASMFTLKASSSGTRFRSSDLLHEGLRRQRQGAAQGLRGRRSDGVRSQAQAHVRGSSGVRGVAQTRNAGRGVGRAPAGHSRPHLWSDSCKRLAAVRFANLGDNREGAPPRFLICYSAQRELFNGVLNVS